MTNILANLENLPVTWDNQSQTWELHDHVTGEIFPVESERGAKALRNIAIHTDSLPWRFARVRTTDRNEWSDYRYFPFACHCCGAELNVEIDPYNICMDCVDLGCTIGEDN